MSSSNIKAYFLSASCLLFTKNKSCLLKLVLRCGTAARASGPYPTGGSCRAAEPDVWWTPACEPEGHRVCEARESIWIDRNEFAVNLQTHESHSIRVCGRGSTGWWPADSACCSSGPRETTAHRTARRLESPDAGCSAARRTSVLLKTVKQWLPDVLIFILTSSRPSVFRWSRTCPIRVSLSLLSSDRNLGSPP